MTLKKVGVTDFHHTFFEMLGNFSFGDYFKKEAITWAWEFLTEILDIPKEKIWVSVYKDDTEAEQIWLNDVGLDPKRLVRLGDKNNFWPSNAKENGPNGPCGPCSEIFYDYGPGPNGEAENDDPGSDEYGRFSEIWNLVFTQYNRLEGGKLEPLPNKNIDTGMGLERLAAVIQGKTNNYETDIFAPILKMVNELIPNIKNDGERRLAFVVADHIRAVVFGINDGVVPSNEGRGYIMKKLINDMSDIAVRTGVQEAVIYKIVPAVVESMGDAYPAIVTKAKDIQGLIENVEKAYIKNVKERIPEYKSKTKDYIATNKDKNTKIGELTFKYRDTFGLGINSMQDALADLQYTGKDLDESWEVFNTLMKKQQDQSRSSSNISKDVFADTDLKLDVPKTEFLGYEQGEGEGIILKNII